MTINILSYNIHWGLSAFKKVDVTQSLSDFIKTSKADIILLQELWLPKGSLEYVIVETLKELWPHQICVATALLPEGKQGNGILSRHPIADWKHIDMSFSGRQARSFLHARLWISEEAKYLSVICTHFGLLRSERLHQAKTLSDYVKRNIDEGESLLLAGDFNDWRKEMTPYFHEELKLREVFYHSRGSHAKSFPAIYPLLSLDRVYVRGLDIQNAKVLRRANWRGSSDHLPLAVNVSF
jgi:endonuclease/exonuclease/phosphatase family metal-dependent hydrolase